MEPEVSLLRSQELPMGLYPKPYESSSQLHVLFL